MADHVQKRVRGARGAAPPPSSVPSMVSGAVIDRRLRLHPAECLSSSPPQATMNQTRWALEPRPLKRACCERRRRECANGPSSCSLCRLMSSTQGARMSNQDKSCDCRAGRASARLLKQRRAGGLPAKSASTMRVLALTHCDTYSVTKEVT